MLVLREEERVGGPAREVPLFDEHEDTHVVVAFPRTGRTAPCIVYVRANIGNTMRKTGDFVYGELAAG